MKQKLRERSLHRDCFGGTLVDAGLAVDTEIDVDFCFAVFHGDRFCRADVNAGFASGTLFKVNFCWQYISSDCTCAANCVK